MRILVIASGQTWLGGLAVQTVLLCCELERLGHEVLAISVGTDVVTDLFPRERVVYDTSRAEPPKQGKSEDPYVFRYEVVPDVARYAIPAPEPLRGVVRPLARLGMVVFASPPPRSRRLTALQGAARAIGAALDRELGNGSGEVPLLERMLLRTDERDLDRIDAIRAWFQPDVEYAADLSLVPLMARLPDRGIPLVSAPQGFEILVRHGVRLRDALDAAQPRLDMVLSGSQANLDNNLGHLPWIASGAVPARVIPYGVALDGGWQMGRAEAVRRVTALADRLPDEDRGPGGLWGPGSGPTDPTAPAAPFVLLCFSRIEVEKGTDLLLHALAILRCEGLPVHLWIAGQAVAGTGFFPLLRQKVRLLDLEDDVSLIGTIHDPLDKVALLRASSAFAAGFIRTEPFGMAYTEAFASALPVVAPDLGAAPELLDAVGDRSSLYRANDTGALAARLRDLARAPERRVALGEQERRAFLERFNATSMAREAAAAFADVARARAGRGKMPSTAERGRAIDASPEPVTGAGRAAA